MNPLLYLGWHIRLTLLTTEGSSGLCALIILNLGAPKAPPINMSKVSPIGNRSQVSLKWIVDIDEDNAKEFVTANFLDTKVVTPSDTETVLRDPSVNAAVITTPTHLHEEIVMRCLQAGKAVFCEKPVATTVEAIERCYTLAESHNIPITLRLQPTIRSYYSLRGRQSKKQ
ncbi:hypothetical protein OS493_032556 [Desmophyllum pertusum]|uniref:Gfo/Idh/MocA-like oxidoreductase N-terminal domain-containing protein n=1 Tax=Desmophyllum pertusum TaxID=174260 RepID=A0A9X0CP04_9CNID|nr:hypothetical protein OS493_032556 [Desmophyllum pertusum]